MALKLAIVRVRDDNGKVDELTLPDGKTIPAVLFDADLDAVLAHAVSSIEQGRPGALRPVLRRAHDLAYRIASQSVAAALLETEQRLKQKTVTLT